MRRLLAARVAFETHTSFPKKQNVRRRDAA